MKTSASAPTEPFRYGAPCCNYDEVCICSQGSEDGMLFRLVDNANKRWYFYNDTTNMLAKVRAVIQPSSDVCALQDARMWTRQVQKGRERIIEAEVKPCSTVQFMEGTPKGFELEFEMEPAPLNEKDLKFKRKPQYRYDKAYNCFKDDSNGLFFRLVDSQSHTWYFHNDTQEYLMSATVEFDERDTVKPLGRTEEVGAPENNSAGVIYRISVKPGTTEPFISGEPEAYRLRFTAEFINKEKPLNLEEFMYENGRPDKSISGHPVQVFKCFSKKGNGLLFRLVDEERRTWSFYNDTTQNIMQVELRLPESEKIIVGHNAQAVPDPQRAGTTLVSMVVPPLATMKLLDGLPKNFELFCRAEVLMDSVPTGKVTFRYTGPNPKVMRYDQVFSTWQGNSPEEGELFRLVDTRRKRWGFYNDTRHLTLKVQVKFIAEEKLLPLGTTRIEVDRSGSAVWYAVDIPPLTTVRFVEGDYSGFELKVMGTSKKSTRRTFVMKD